MTDNPLHRPIQFPQRTPEEQRAWLERCCEAEDASGGCISAGGLYAEMAKELTLNDFAQMETMPENFRVSLAPGDTEVWYRPYSANKPDDIPFWKVTPPKISELAGSYILMGKIAETHKPMIYEVLNLWGEYFPSEGFNPLNAFIAKVGADHTSMSIGDVIKIGDQAWMCDKGAWTPLEH